MFKNKEEMTKNGEVIKLLVKYAWDLASQTQNVIPELSDDRQQILKHIVNLRDKISRGEFTVDNQDNELTAILLLGTRALMKEYELYCIQNGSSEFDNLIDSLNIGILNNDSLVVKKSNNKVVNESSVMEFLKGSTSKFRRTIPKTILNIHNILSNSSDGLTTTGDVYMDKFLDEFYNKHSKDLSTDMSLGAFSTLYNKFINKYSGVIPGATITNTFKQFKKRYS